MKRRYFFAGACFSPILVRDIHAAGGWSNPVGGETEDVSQFKRALDILKLQDFSRAVVHHKPSWAFEILLASSRNQFGLHLFSVGESIEGNACASSSRRTGPGMAMTSCISGIHESNSPGAFKSFDNIRKWQPVDGLNKGVAGQDHLRLLFRKYEKDSLEKILIINAPRWKTEIKNISVLLSNTNSIIAALFGEAFLLPVE